MIIVLRHVYPIGSHQIEKECHILKRQHQIRMFQTVVIDIRLNKWNKSYGIFIFHYVMWILQFQCVKVQSIPLPDCVNDNFSDVFNELF